MLDEEELELRELELLPPELEREGVERREVEVERPPEDELEELDELDELLLDRPAPGAEELLEEVLLLLAGLLERGLKVKPEVSWRSRVSVPS